MARTKLKPRFRADVYALLLAKKGFWMDVDAASEYRYEAGDPRIKSKLMDQKCVDCRRFFRTGIAACVPYHRQVVPVLAHADQHCRRRYGCNDEICKGSEARLTVSARQDSNQILRARPRSHCRALLRLPLPPSHCHATTADRTATSHCSFNTPHAVAGPGVQRGQHQLLQGAPQPPLAPLQPVRQGLGAGREWGVREMQGRADVLAAGVLAHVQAQGAVQDPGHGHGRGGIR